MNETTLESFTRGYFPQLDGRELKKVCRETLGYLLKTADKDRSRQASNDLSNAIQRVAGAAVNTRDYRRDLYVHGYLLKNVKLWLWWTAAKGLRPRAARDAMVQFAVKPEDWPLAGLTMGDRRLRGKLEKMSKTYEAHTVAEFDDLVERAIRAADNAIRSYAFRKLRFLERTRFLTSNDLLGELKHHAVLTLMRQYPRIESDEHARNTVSMCVPQRGTSLINENTNKGSEFLVQNPDGTWDGLVFSYDQSEGEAVPMLDPLDPQAGSRLSSDVNVGDGLVSLGSEFILRRYAGRKREFAAMMLGIENEGFSEYLAEFGLPPNHVLFDEAAAAGGGDMLERYVRHAAGWLGVKEKAAWSFLHEMGRDLDA